jgi:hypothetical protein
MKMPNAEDNSLLYRKKKKTVPIGESLELPLGAIGIHLQEIPPFESVMVTWFEPVDPHHTGVNNLFTVHEIRYDGDEARVPNTAIAPTTGECVDRDSGRGFYLG